MADKDSLMTLDELRNNKENNGSSPIIDINTAEDISDTIEEENIEKVKLSPKQKEIILTTITLILAIAMAVFIMFSYHKYEASEDKEFLASMTQESNETKLDTYINDIESEYPAGVTGEGKEFSDKLGVQVWKEENGIEEKDPNEW